MWVIEKWRLLLGHECRNPIPYYMREKEDHDIGISCPAHTYTHTHGVFVTVAPPLDFFPDNCFSLILLGLLSVFPGHFLFP